MYFISISCFHYNLIVKEFNLSTLECILVYCSSEIIQLKIIHLQAYIFLSPGKLCQKYFTIE